MDRPPAEDVYAYASDPANIPTWAPGLGTSIERVGDEWFVGTGDGRVRVAFAAPNPFGVLDHEVTLPSGEVVSIPMRVIADGDACEVVFTLRRQPAMSDARLRARHGPRAGRPRQAEAGPRGGPLARAQPTACFTMAVSFFSSSAVSLVIAHEVAHMEPSSSLASSLKPKVE